MSHRLPDNKKHRKLTPISKARWSNILTFMAVCLLIGLIIGIIFVALP